MHLFGFLLLLVVAVYNVIAVCDTISGFPQPTKEYPAILFQEENYNNCTTSGDYMKIATDRFYKWGENGEGRNRFRIVKWKSMLILPNCNLTFRACCPSGNNFVSTTNSWSSTTNMNDTVINHPKLSGTDGIWYLHWLHWSMHFDVKINSPVDATSIPACGTCNNGECGLTGRCECYPGYSGSTCETSPTDPSYPTESKPMVLFDDYDFKGAYKLCDTDQFYKFASNANNVRTMEYKSVRFSFNRTVVFSRTLVHNAEWPKSSNIRNISQFMLSNVHIADPLWYNYDRMYDVEFYMKVNKSN